MMKYFCSLTVLILTLLFWITGSAQSPYSNRQMAYLKTTAKTWGLVNYYHPEVAGTDKKKWEKALSDFLINFEEVKQPSDFNQKLSDLLSKAGRISFPEEQVNLEEKYKSIAEYNNLHFDWVSKARHLNGSNRSTLQQLVDDYRPLPLSEKHHHFTFTTKFRNQEDKSEKVDKEVTELPDRQVRLMALFKLWNHFRYFFPYQDKVSIRWDELLTEYIPKFARADENRAYHLRMQEFVSEFRDARAFAYSNIVFDHVGRYRIPVELITLEGEVYVESVAKETRQNYRIMPADSLISVDQVGVDSLYRKLRPYVGAGHEVLRHAIINDYLLRGEKYSQAYLQLRGDYGGVKSASLTREVPFFEPAIKEGRKSYEYVSENIAYINTKTLGQEEVKDAFKNTDESDTLIIDLRNGNNEVISKLVKYLAPDKKMVLQAYRPLPEYPGKYQILTRENDHKMLGGHYEGKLVLLTNEKCRGLCEQTILELQELRDVTTVGRPTAGVMGQPLSVNLPGSIEVRYSGSRITRMNGSTIFGHGVKPDVLIQPNQKALQIKKDTILHRAKTLHQSSR